MSQPHGAAGVTRFVTPRTEEPKASSELVTQAAPTPKKEQGAAFVKPTQPAEEVAPRPIPTMGFPAFWYGFLHLFNPSVTPPHLSKKEVAAIAERLAIEEREARAVASYNELRHLTDEVPHLVVVFVGVKGSAATTTSMVHASSVLADDTRTLVYGADFNPASGTAGARLGKEFGETVSIQEFSAIVDEVKGDRKLVNARLRPTRYGVRVLSADDYTKIPGEQYGTTTAKMLEVLDSNCDYLMLDTPNDITTAAAREVLKAADIIVFTANVREVDSLRLLRVSMDTVRELGHRQKVKDSVVVISNAPEEATYRDYTKYLGDTNLHHEVTRPLQPGEFDGQMLVVPHDPAIARNVEVDLGAYDWKTIQAYRDLSIAILEQARKANQRTTLTALGRS